MQTCLPFPSSLRQLPYIHAKRVRYLYAVAYARLRPELAHRRDRRLRLTHRLGDGAVREIFPLSVNLNLVPKRRL